MFAMISSAPCSRFLPLKRGANDRDWARSSRMAGRNLGVSGMARGYGGTGPATPTRARRSTADTTRRCPAVAVCSLCRYRRPRRAVCTSAEDVWSRNSLCFHNPETSNRVRLTR
jgi:hypothetical protein